MSLVVSDTSPLNYLILIGQIAVVPKLFGSLLVPPAVITEMLSFTASGEVKSWAGNPPSWVQIKAAKVDLGLNIGSGEDQAISLAKEIDDALLLADDRRARVAAAKLGITALGTLAVLNLADEAGLLDFDSALQRLRSTNFRVGEATVATVIRDVHRRRVR